MEFARRRRKKYSKKIGKFKKFREKIKKNREKKDFFWIFLRFFFNENFQKVIDFFDQKNVIEKNIT